MKLLKQTGLFLFAALILFSCGKGSETVEATEAELAAAAMGDTLNLETPTSIIGWTGYKPAGKHFGKIPAINGFLTAKEDSITSGTFTFDVVGLTIEDMVNTDENYGKLYGHLQSPDFFDATNHPQATFVITGVEVYNTGDVIADKEEFATDNTPSSDSAIAPQNPTHWISGNLTMRGVTKNIKFPASVAIASGELTAKAGFNINRTDWGLAYGDEATAVDKAKDQFIYNTISLVLDVKAAK